MAKTIPNGSYRRCFDGISMGFRLLKTGENTADVPWMIQTCRFYGRGDFMVSWPGWRNWRRMQMLQWVYQRFVSLWNPLTWVQNTKWGELKDIHKHGYGHLNNGNNMSSRPSRPRLLGPVYPLGIFPSWIHLDLLRYPHATSVWFISPWLLPHAFNCWSSWPTSSVLIKNS